MEYISYCGLLCNECPVYLATKEDDEKMKEQLAREYSFEGMIFTKEDMNCYGCFSEQIKDSKMCGNCTIMNCAKDKGLKNCGYCSNYPCTEIDKHLPIESNNRKRLDDINKTV